MLKAGDQYSYKFSFSQREVETFAQVTGDNNPLHLNEKFAEETIFKRPIMHGMLSATVFSKIFGTRFPGPGTIYMEQDLKFKRPMFTKEPYEAEIEIVEIQGKHLAKFNTQIKHQETGKVHIEGYAVLMHKDKIPA